MKQILIVASLAVLASASNVYPPTPRRMTPTCPYNIQWVTNVDWQAIQTSWFVQFATGFFESFTGCYTSYLTNVDFGQTDTDCAACISFGGASPPSCGLSAGGGKLISDVGGVYKYVTLNTYDCVYLDADYNNYIIAFACTATEQVLFALTRTPVPPAKFYTEFPALLQKYNIDTPYVRINNSGCQANFGCFRQDSGTWDGSIFLNSVQ